MPARQGRAFLLAHPERGDLAVARTEETVTGGVILMASGFPLRREVAETLDMDTGEIPAAAGLLHKADEIVLYHLHHKDLWQFLHARDTGRAPDGDTPLALQVISVPSGRQITVIRSSREFALFELVSQAPRYGIERTAA